MFKKKLLVSVLSFMIGISCLFTNTANVYACGPGCEHIIEPETIVIEESLSGYMRNVYDVTQRPELDEAVYKAFDLFEANKNKSSYLVVYKGSYLECGTFADYFNLNYGYTKDMEVKVYKGSTYFVAFPNTLNADQKIDNYLATVKKAQGIADTLACADTDQTINNITNWIDKNVTYYYDYDFSDPNFTSYYYGGYDNKPIVCGGYAAVMYQLCSMNNVKCSIVDAVVSNEYFHTFNVVSYSDKDRYVDTVEYTSVSDTLWNNYRITNLYAEMQ